ncbi:uncharacterized protein B0T23DRAFT_171816 [Neurospora hispaniola]|uniref:Uncharacterized protein n=1 Tax=Neurospora hispaniola TaxID=588809 RepID=A0AAJ0MQG6_9PEZI|nr:hypothetical protein B0T23DRAFT_171816 [Neurospora hispaniola]
MTRGSRRQQKPRGMHNGYTTQAVEAIKVSQFGASNVKRQDLAGFHGKSQWAMTTFEHLSRSHATEAIDTAGRTRHGLTSGPCSVGEFAKQRVDRIPAFGVALYPIFVVLFLPTLRQAEQKPSGEVVTQLQGKRFEAHARSQGTPTLVGLLVLGHSKASLQSSTPNTRPATLVPCAPCNSTIEVAPTVPTHLDP